MNTLTLDLDPTAPHHNQISALLYRNNLFTTLPHLHRAACQGLMNTLPPDLDPTALDRKAWMWIGIASAIIAGVVLLVTLLMIRRIWIAVACIKVSWGGWVGVVAPQE